MGLITQRTIDAIRDYHDIASVVSKYVQLKKRGKSHLGLCPFHSERTPSFHVNNEKGMFYCFGCHESGDLISFVQKVENLSFADSVKLIAEQTGIEYEEEAGSSNRPYKDNEKEKRCQDALNWFQGYCEAALEKFPEILDYLSARGVSEAMQMQFHLGWVPEIATLRDAAKKAGVAEEHLIEAGVLQAHSATNLSCRFQGRLLFPIANSMGQTVGFSGRRLDEGKSAKYINSAESPLFNKSHLLYGFHMARPAAKKAEYLILTEGYFDVILAYQNDVKATIASMGTALTAQQVQKIQRVTKQVYLAMDTDEAGKVATEKAAEMCQAQGLLVRILPLVDKDLADFFYESPEDFPGLLHKAQHPIEFKLNRLKEKYPSQSIDELSKIVNELIPSIKIEKDAIIRNHYIALTAKELNIDIALIVEKLGEGCYTKYISPRAKKQFLPYERSNKYQKAEASLIVLVAMNDSVRSTLQEIFPELLFSSETRQKLFSDILSSSLTGQDLLSQLQGEQKNDLSQLLVKDENIEGGQWKDYVTLLKESKLEYRIKDIQDQLKQLPPQAEDEADQLLEQLNHLIKKQQGIQ